MPELKPKAVVLTLIRSGLFLSGCFVEKKRAARGSTSWCHLGSR